MLSYKMDFSSCDIMPGFGKSSHIYIHTYIHTNSIAPHILHDYLSHVAIKTHNSELRGQEEAVPTRQTSEFTGSTTVKLSNALNKPP